MQYLIPNRAEYAPLLQAIFSIPRQPFCEIVQGNRVLAYMFRFSMPEAVECELLDFDIDVNLEFFRYEPDRESAAAGAS